MTNASQHKQLTVLARYPVYTFIFTLNASKCYVLMTRTKYYISVSRLHGDMSWLWLGSWFLAHSHTLAANGVFVGTSKQLILTVRIPLMPVAIRNSEFLH